MLIVDSSILQCLLQMALFLHFLGRESQRNRLTMIERDNQLEDGSVNKNTATVSLTNDDQENKGKIKYYCTIGLLVLVIFVFVFV